jgi:ElaB/YqjD/DUF883 family membrane-anchored ribosome-binding protein
MSTSSPSDPAFAALREDLAALQRDMKELIHDRKADATESARSVAAEGKYAVKDLVRRIEAHPLRALLIAAAVGYVSGRVLPR